MSPIDSYRGEFLPRLRFALRLNRLTVRICTHSWLNAAEQRYCYWIVSENRCRESGLAWIQGLRLFFLDGILCSFSEELQVNHSTQNSQLH